MASSPRNRVRAVLDEGARRPTRRFQLVREVASELSKVTWPTRSEATRLTWLVIGVAVAVGVFVGLWDYGFSRLADQFLF